MNYKNFVFVLGDGYVEIYRVSKFPAKIIPNLSAPNNYVEQLSTDYLERIDGTIDDAKHYVDSYFAE